jgi:hypothetical protein
VFTRNTEGAVSVIRSDQYHDGYSCPAFKPPLPGETQTLSQVYHSVLNHLIEKLPGDDTIIHFYQGHHDANGGDNLD